MIDTQPPHGAQSQPTLGHCYAQLKRKLDSQDARHLLCHVAQCTHAHLYSQAQQVLTQQQQIQLKHFLHRRQQGEPLAYLLGTQPFYGLTLTVTPDTLIPRADTEALVDWVLQQGTPQQPLTLVDLGTGSGAIALAVAAARPHWSIVAVEHSAPALAVAQHNAQQLGLQRIHWKQGNWLVGHPPAHYDIIVSNPPYIAAGDPDLQPSVLRYEPHTALIAADNGLADLRQIVHQGFHCLKPLGYLALEHGYTQADQVRKLFVQQGYHCITTLKDCSHRERVTLGQRPALPAGTGSTS